MKTVALFFVILIAISACQQEPIKPTAPESAQEDTSEKKYPPKADHRTKHLVEVTNSTPPDPEYVDSIRWPYNERGALESQITMIKEDCKQAFHLPFDSSRVMIVCYEPDDVDMLTYPVTEQELSQVCFFLELYCSN